jgi:hypothetical protein
MHGAAYQELEVSRRIDTMDLWLCRSADGLRAALMCSCLLVECCVSGRPVYLGSLKGWSASHQAKCLMRCQWPR